MLPPYKTDISVLLRFFNRPEALEGIWKQIRLARPSRLFLYQDGARNENDLPLIDACRRIVEEVDWTCEVHRLYQEKNYGCDPSAYIAVKWAFSMTDRCMVFEDDDVPAESFFPFCAEMLERYADDRRIGLVCGMNIDEETKDLPYDYFFTTTFSINGWATWKRVVDLWDESYSWLDDEFNREQLSTLIRKRRYQQDFLEFSRYHRSTGKAYYETIFHATLFFNSMLTIVPRLNQVENLGACGEGTHLSGTNATLPRAYRRLFEMRKHELDFPLRHPRYVIENVEYKERQFKLQGWGHPWIKIGRSLEELWLTLRHGQFRRIGQAVKARVRKWLGKSRWD